MEKPKLLSVATLLLLQMLSIAIVCLNLEVIKFTIMEYSKKYIFHYNKIIIVGVLSKGYRINSDLFSNSGFYIYT